MNNFSNGRSWTFTDPASKQIELKDIFVVCFDKIAKIKAWFYVLLFLWFVVHKFGKLASHFFYYYRTNDLMQNCKDRPFSN